MEMDRGVLPFLRTTKYCLERKEIKFKLSDHTHIAKILEKETVKGIVEIQSE